MRIAILISGYLRGFKENINKIKKNVIQNYPYDIYIHITNNKEEKYDNEKISIDYIKTRSIQNCCYFQITYYFLKI